jgi:hypothetical protein
LSADAGVSRWDSDEDGAGPPQSRWDDDSHEAAEEDGAGASGARGPAQRDGLPGLSEGAQEAVLADDDATPGVVSDEPNAASLATSLRDVQRRDMLQECRRKDEFEILKQVGAGTFGLVSKCGHPPSRPCLA